MKEQKKKSIAETLHLKIQTPWVWLVFVLTICLTALFYVSQKPPVAIYSQYVKSLCDYQFAETSLMRSMERVRTGYGVDSAVVISQMMMLREVAVSFDAAVEKLKHSGYSGPSSASVLLFRTNVLAKVSCLHRYLTERMEWFDELEIVSRAVAELPTETAMPLMRKLDSARVGYDVSLDEPMGLPMPLSMSVESLLQENQDLYNAWNNFDNDKTLSASDELLHFFQMENLKEISLSANIPLAFYFLSLVLLLATFFFIFKSKE